MTLATKAKRIHIALAVHDLEDAIAEFTARLGIEPKVVAGGEYALFLTHNLNLSLSEMPGERGKLRHLGFEDEEAQGFSVETDSNGFTWEHFTLPQQAAEIRQHWPDAKWHPKLGD